MIARTTSDSPSQVSLSMKGDLLSTNAEERGRAILESLQSEPEPWSELVLNLSNARMVDSVGLNMLIALNRRLERQNRSLKLLIASPAVHRVVLFTRLNEIAEVVYKERR
jgi:anti-anti-sigma factor